MTQIASSSAEVRHVLVATALPEPRLLQQLHKAGFAAHTVDTLAAVEPALRALSPQALIIDVDFPDTPAGGITLIDALHANDLSCPVLFIAEHGDTATRVEAVRTGGRGFFARPITAGHIVEYLRRCLLDENALPPCRVLVLAGKDQAAAISKALSANPGISVQCQEQLLRSLEALEQTLPDIVVLDLDIAILDGPKLHGAIRQHPLGEHLPIVLLVQAQSLSQRLAGPVDERDDVLVKPVDHAYLSWFVLHRLRREQAQQNRIGELSRHDAVSGLYNRHYFLTELQRRFAARIPPKIAVMLILVRNMRAFQAIFDAATADEVFAWTADRLQRSVSGNVLLARFGDSLFALLYESDDEQALLNTARDLRRVVEDGRYRTNSHEIGLKTCIGIALTGPAVPDYRELVRRADVACTLARETRRDFVQVYYETLEQSVSALTDVSFQRSILDKVCEAVAEDRLQLMFQPIVSLLGEPGRRYEVLLRLRSRTGRDLLPETVFGVVQQHRLGVTLDRWVISHCLRLLRGCRRQTPETIMLFINVTLASIREPSLYDWLADRLARAELDPSCLIFEISDFVARRHRAEVQTFASRIRDLGCRLSLQGFSGSPEAIELLHMLEIDFVKFPLAAAEDFVADTTARQRLHELAQTLADAGATLIATGVEDTSVLSLLRSCGIQLAQGFLLQRPSEQMDYDFAAHVF